MSEFVFERFAQTLAANQPLKVVIRASELRVIAAMWPLTVIFYRRGHAVGSATGVLAGDYFRGTEFDAFEVLNGANAQAVVIGVSSGAAGSDRITGSVEVIDGGRSRALAHMAFWAKTAAAGVAAQYAHCQLWNPAGSGRNLMIKKLAAYTLAGAYLECGFGFHGVQEANAFAAQPLSKFGGSAASVASARYENNAGILLTQNIGSLILRSQTMEQYEFSEPFVVPPGKGFVLHAGVANAPLTMNVEYYEESTT